jgi:hypothetical protein
MILHAKEKVAQYNEYERKYGFTVSQVKITNTSSNNAIITPLEVI